MVGYPWGDEMSTCFQRFLIPTALVLHLVFITGCTSGTEEAAGQTPNDVGVMPDTQTLTPDVGIPSFSLTEATSTTSEIVTIDTDSVTSYWTLADDSVLYTTDTSFVHLKNGTATASINPHSTSWMPSPSRSKSSSLMAAGLCARRGVIRDLTTQHDLLCADSSQSHRLHELLAV